MSAHFDAGARKLLDAVFSAEECTDEEDRRHHAFGLVADERERQEGKFPDQHIPSVDPSIARRPTSVAARQTRMAAEYEIPSEARAKYNTRHATENEELTWTHVLVEELSEAVAAAVEFGEGSDEHLQEVVQVAAVALRWLEDLLWAREQLRVAERWAQEHQATT